MFFNVLASVAISSADAVASVWVVASFVLVVYVNIVASFFAAFIVLVAIANLDLVAVLVVMIIYSPLLFTKIQCLNILKTKTR